MTPEEEALLIKGEEAREQIKNVISAYCSREIAENSQLLTRTERIQLVDDICNELLGLGPLEPLLKDDSITEIMVNGSNDIFIEQGGKVKLIGSRFYDETHLMSIVERILNPLGRRVDESSPLVDARLADGSRVNIIIPPLSLIEPVLTIRKFSRNALSIDDLMRFGTLSENMAEFLEASVKARLNILVSGGTGSGKTTTLNALSSFISKSDRIVTIEDAAELKLQQRHVIPLEARLANLEGTGAITIRDLVRNALRMRPDRIIVGEVRSGEVLDMLQAMNTGHDGSLTTAHANSPRDAFARLETMVLMAGMELPLPAIRAQISSAINLILQQSRISDGTRKITHITEVHGMEGNTIILQDLFHYVQDRIDERGKSVGHFEASGLQPRFMDKFQMNGVKVPLSLFRNDNISRYETKSMDIVTIFMISLVLALLAFLYVFLSLYSKQTPEAQLRRRLDIMIERAEEKRAKISQLLDQQNNAPKTESIVSDDTLTKKGFFERIFSSILYSLESRLQKLAPTELIKVIEDQIFSAGKQGVWSVRRLAAFWVLSFTSGTMLALWLVRNSSFQLSQEIIIMSFGMILGAILPFVIINAKIKQRKKELRKQLPSFLDLLCVSVQAGLSFDGAVAKIVSRMKGTLVDEFKRMQNDVNLGMTHQYALTQMAKRCDLEEVYLFASSVIQAERLGTSMSNTLKMQADNMRDRRRQYIKAEALKAPVKILFPMILFIFPSIFVVFLVPTLLFLMKHF